MSRITNAGAQDPTLEVGTGYPFPRSCPFDPSSELSRRREVEPVSRIQLADGNSPWLVTRYEDARQILADPRVSSDTDRENYPFRSEGRRVRRAASRTFITMDDPEHARYRKMLISEFTARNTESLRRPIEEVVTDLLDAMERGPRPVDLFDVFALPLPSMVICHLLGVPYADHHFFQDRSRALLDTRTNVESSMQANQELRDYLTELMAAKETKPTDDVLGRLARNYVLTGQLSRAEAVKMAVLLLVAGHETTASTITLGLLALLRHPDQAAQVRDGEPTVVSSAVEELLRLYTVAHGGERRTALEDIQVAGVTIRAGDGIIVAVDSANRDATAFDSPDQLDIHRQPNHHLAFGFGVHRCLGLPLARLELQIAYPALLRRFPTLHLAVPIPDLRFREQMMVYGVQALPVSW